MEQIYMNGMPTYEIIAQPLQIKYQDCDALQNFVCFKARLEVTKCGLNVGKTA